MQGQKKARNPEESQANNHMRKRESCRGRDRTSTRRLAIAQRVSGQSWSAWRSALCYVYPVILTLETRGHVCLKFHHPTVYFVFQIALLEQIYGQWPFHSKLFNKYFEIIEIIQIFAVFNEFILK